MATGGTVLNKVLVFPRDFRTVDSWMKAQLSLVCGDASLVEIAEGAHSIEMMVGAKQVRLNLQGFKIPDAPKAAKSKGSQALYLASAKGNGSTLLLQYLPPNAKTSLHYHAHTRETFHVLEGSAKLFTPWGIEVPLEKGDSVTNNEFVPHQVVTHESAAIILIEMITQESGVGMQDHFYVDLDQAIDIHSKGAYPSSALSNFAAYHFHVDSVICESMEGFLQSLKERDLHEQREICALTGGDAKRRGEVLNQTRNISDPLYWRGKEIDRNSEAYDHLLDVAYSELMNVRSFQEALLATGDALLVHSIGKKTPDVTILTETELCSKLMRMRYFLQQLKQSCSE